MKFKLRRVGNSLGVLIPAFLVKGMKAGEEIEIPFPEPSAPKVDKPISPLQRALKENVKPIYKPESHE